MEDKTKFELRNLPIPNLLYKRNDLTLVATKVYSFIHAYTNPFFFGNQHLAEMFGCSTQAISDAIKTLQEKKFIHCTYQSRPTGGRFRLVIDDYSDNKQMTNGVLDDERATSHLLIDKDIKDNNIKEKNFSDKKEESGNSETFITNKGLSEDFANWQNNKAAAKARKAQNRWGVPRPQEKTEYKQFEKRGGKFDAKEIY